MNLRLIYSLGIIIFIPLFVFGQKKSINLGVIGDCESVDGSDVLGIILEESRTLMSSEYRILLDQSNILYSKCSAKGVRDNLQQLLNDPGIDLIIGIDPISSHILASSGPYPKPVIASIVINPQVQKLPITAEGNSGVDNLVYIVLPYSPQRDLEVFYEMVKFNHLGVILDEATFRNIPPIAEFLRNALGSLGVEYSLIYAKPTTDEMIAQFNKEIDAIYYLPSDIINNEVKIDLISRINDLGIPGFSLFGRLDVNFGVLAGIAPASNFDLISRRVALNMQRIVGGDDASEIGVSLPKKEELVINMETARKINYSPNWDILQEAVIINEQRSDINRTVNLYSLIQEGLENNLDLKISALDVQATEQDVNIADASVLPQLDLSINHTLVDSESAVASNGRNPEHLGSAAASFQQIIYSEQILANRAIQKLLLKSQEAQLQLQSLDVILDVSNSYLNLLRAKTSEKIQKQNLETTRRNLELARVSNAIGQSGPSDLYRWQSEISTAKANLLNATAQRIQAEYALNQLILRPVNEPFVTEEIDIDDPSLIINDERIGQYINNPREFYIYADFLVQETKSNLPELQQLDYNINAQDRSRLLFRRNLYAPNIALSGGANYEMYRGGQGTETPPGFGLPNDLTWSVGIGASIPVFTGGERRAQFQQSKIDLEKLRKNRLNLERILEQQTRSVLENVRASYTNIGLTKDAEVAAVKNFALVQDAYSKGAVTITQLLDAQNAAISAQLNSANAVYIFMIDIISMGRATGEYYMLMSEHQKNEYAARFTEFYISKNN